MLVNFGCGIRLHSRGQNPFFSIQGILYLPKTLIQTQTQTQTLTLAMADSSSPDNRRPTCPSCSRPTRVCLCTRFKTPALENTIAVTLLQHNLEKKHPLNSAKIATLGLKNVSLAHVSDVISEAHFEIHFLESNIDLGPHDSVENRKKVEALQPADISVTNLDMGPHDSVGNRKQIEAFQPADISFTINKRGAITSQSQDFEQLLANKDVLNCLQNGFTVKRLQRWSDGNYVQEFEIVVPLGSVLLFPSENSVGIENVDFNVKNLIVLDGTWAKATRMYKENPWLRMLPHVKLDMDKLSLYAEVRRQPKARCLSSIESIVYALKAFGKEDVAGLDCLLDVFESMIVDQRRCKDERLKSEIDIVSM
uniref:uncharacterized protein LOC122580006 n=1 Tax=Erigeron canadensis TaxID=72917 RepID=UPI001CB96F0C|nr:uncharacterized protein LOC122580006 [Erigeron canadensis]